jgi:flagellin
MPKPIDSTTPFNITRELSANQKKLSTVYEQISTGSRIHNPAKSPADSAVVFQMDTRLKSIESAMQNILQAESMIQCAVGSLSNTNDILTKLSRLAVEASNGLVFDYNLFDDSFQKLLSQIDINASIKWGDYPLLAGSSGSSVFIDPNTSGTASTSGFALGAIDPSNITVNYDGSTYTVNLLIGVQRFQGIATPNSGTPGSLSLTSTIDPGTQVTLSNVSFTNGDPASTVKSAIMNAAGLNTGTPVQFYPVNAVAKATANALVPSVKASGNATTGDYYLSYGTDGTNAIFKWQGSSSLYTTSFNINEIATNAGTATNNFSGDLFLSDGTCITLSNFDLTNTNSLLGAIVHVAEGGSRSFTLQVGDDYSQTTTFQMGISTINGLNLTGYNLSSQTEAQQAITAIQNAINVVSDLIAKCGDDKLQLEASRKNLNQISYSKQVARSDYADADIPQTIIDATTYEALVDSSSAALVSMLESSKKLAELVKRVQG